MRHQSNYAFRRGLCDKLLESYQSLEKQRKDDRSGANKLTGAQRRLNKQGLEETLKQLLAKCPTHFELMPLKRKQRAIGENR